MEKQTDMDWWISMPKVELHAHLNGSIRDSTLLELARGLGEKGTIVFSDVEHAILKSDRSLHEVFKLFDLIHIVTTDHKIVTRITKEVVEDFAAENVVYLELRTTPKRNDLRGMSKRSYTEAVLEGLRNVTAVEVDLAPQGFGIKNSGSSFGISNLCNGAEKKKIYVRLLLSIDRRETTASAMETVKLALEMRHLGIAGIDLSGNPIVGEWATFLPALQFAREQGLPITLHCGEVPNPEEIQAMLDFLPGRIGHACCFGEEEWRKLKACKIPVEICLTSNIRTETISSIDLHHFVDLYNAEHPIVLCTDDAGVFSTSLSGEYILAASTFGFGRIEMFRLARNAIEFIFADDAVKRELREIFDFAARKLDL
ncbi:adenosine deaminase [Sarracenia purpurea var. burkii]